MCVCSLHSGSESSSHLSAFTFAALLAYRIWSIDRQVQGALNTDMESRLSPIVRIVLESGVMNAAYLFVFVMTLEFGSQALEIMSEMVRLSCLFRSSPR